MSVSYEKLWNLMKANKMTRGALAKAAGVSTYTMAKMGKSETVHMDVLVRLCKIFHCDIGDIIEIIEEQV